MARRNHWIAASLTALALAASGCGNKLEGLSDEDLQDKAYACSRESKPSPGAAIACDNYRKECQRRRQLGRFVC